MIEGRAEPGPWQPLQLDSFGWRLIDRFASVESDDDESDDEVVRFELWLFAAKISVVTPSVILLDSSVLLVVGLVVHALTKTIIAAVLKRRAAMICLVRTLAPAEIGIPNGQLANSFTGCVVDCV